MKVKYTVTVDTDTREHADQVIAERTGYDEDYGFPYTIEADTEHVSVLTDLT